MIESDNSNKENSASRLGIVKTVLKSLMRTFKIKNSIVINITFDILIFFSTFVHEYGLKKNFVGPPF